MILLVDNYDSFVYNLKRYLVRLGQEVVVVRNDQVDLEEDLVAKYQAIVISPGPQSPDQAGVCLELIRRFHERVPMLGICLGHQAIWQALGGRIIRAKTPIHGRSSSIQFKPSSMFASSMFAGIDNPFVAARYHSLVADPTTQPLGLKVSAWSEDHEIMAIEHERFPLFGLQFHPESILTESGYQLLRNFLVLAGVDTASGVLPPSDYSGVWPTSAKPAGKAEAEEAKPFAVFPGSKWH
ncbi:MAG: aminodeoxychorismate/anthranilate synthase component II [Pirellulaceae bacterium]|jgi:anthranilate synthase/aminodeoxychorismate synthase-like glutamine amidotransferase|nr:aminodeoxychorismate/anthranilate synthase component II [Pirellulaceae bacterium]